MNQKVEALRIIEEALSELESSKGSVLAGVQKLARASTLVKNDDVANWCAIQLGDKTLIRPIEKLVGHLNTAEENQAAPKFNDETNSLVEALEKIGLKHEFHFSVEEMSLKADPSGGGYQSIGFIEERYADLVRTKRRNDKTYYKINLSKHIAYIKQKAHEHASKIYEKLKFSGTVSGCFDVLRDAVDDHLLDLSPQLSEQLMLAFNSVSSENAESWSHALTSCRRLIEGLADKLMPASEVESKGRSLGATQYINRLWAFMDDSIESATNKEVAKSHVDYLGSWLEKTNKMAHKGVHAEVSQLEAIKSVFHTYLVVADVLQYTPRSMAISTQVKADINNATLDELEVGLGVSRAVAKDIFKARINLRGLSITKLRSIKGVGPKIIAKASEFFSIEE